MINWKGKEGALIKLIDLEGIMKLSSGTSNKDYELARESLTFLSNKRMVNEFLTLKIMQFCIHFNKQVFDINFIVLTSEPVFSFLSYICVLLIGNNVPHHYGT